MSEAGRPPDPQDPRRGMHPRPRRGRVLLLGTFVGLIVMVFLIITLVGRCGQGEDQARAGDPRGTELVLGPAAPTPVGG